MESEDPPYVSLFLWAMGELSTKEHCSLKLLGLSSSRLKYNRAIINRELSPDESSWLIRNNFARGIFAFLHF